MKEQGDLIFYLYSTASGKYRKYRHRLDRAVESGRFQQFSRRKKQRLLGRLQKLCARLRNLYLQLKLIAAGAAASLTLSLINPATAQTTIGPFNEALRSETPLRWPFRFSAGPRPSAIDYDQDGDFDIVVGYQGSLHYFQNDGTEEKPLFNEKTGPDNPFENIGPGSGDAAPVFIDFDHDLDLDIFVGTDDDDVNAILYYKNVSGAFELQDPDTDWNNAAKTGNPFYSLSSHVLGSSNYLAEHAKLLFADWDNDGDWDAFIGQDLEATDFYYYENRLNTEGAFIPQSPADVGFPSGLNSSGYGQAPQFADVDQDGDKDFIIGSDGGGLIFLANNGENIFEQQDGPWNAETKQGNPFYEVGYSLTVPHIVDLDNDVDPDVILGVSGGGFEGRSMVFLENLGDGVFVEKNDFDNPFDGYISSGDYTHSYKGGIPEFIDVDNDGDLDVLIGDKYSSDIIFYRNDEGEFHKAQSPLGEVTFTMQSNPSVADINGDGFKDIFVGQIGSEPDDYRPGMKLFINNHDGTFTEILEDVPFTDEIYYEPLDLAFVDVDGDNDFDVWLCSDDDPVFYRNTGTALNPVFVEDEANDPLPSFSGYKNRLNAIDIDRDHDLDIVRTHYGSDMRLFINDGNGAFTEVTGADNPFDFVPYDQIFPGFADHDGDGDLDVFINVIGGEFRFLKNDNLAPQLTAETEDLELDLTPGGGPSIVNPEFGLDDPDNDEYREAIVKILGYEPGHDFLELSRDWSESFEDYYFNEETGEFHLIASGLTSGSDFENALGDITYEYIGDEGEFQRRKNPASRSVTKTVRFEVFDIDRTNPIPLDFVYTYVNLAPELSSTAPDISYTTPSGIVVIDNTITITDVDDLNIASAAISITNFQPGQDVLLFTDQNGISGNFSSVTGVLTLTGSAPKADYETALRSVRYSNAASVPNTTTRTISFEVNDGEGTSTAEDIDLHFNFAPALLASSLTTSYGGSPVFVDNAITVTDVGDAISSASIYFSAGYQSGEDVFVFTDQNGITGSYNAVAGAMVLSGTASRADYETALRSITYNNISSTPTTSSRTVEIFVVDDLSQASNQVYITINYTSQAPPQLTSSVSLVNYSSGVLAVNNNITITDSDDTNLESATVSILSGFTNPEDVLAFTPAGGITGSYDPATGILSLSGTASLTDYQNVLRSVTYQNTNTGDRNKTTRNVVFRANDGSDNSNSLGTTVTLLNQAPALVNTAAPPPYVTGALTIAGQLSLTDGDNATLQSAMVLIASGLQSSEDILLYTDQNGIAGIYTSATGTLQLSGNATVTNYQAALRSVQYQNTNPGDRNKATRSIEITVNDGATISNLITTSIVIPNQVPTVLLSVDPPLYGSGVTLIADQLILADNDNATLQSASLIITSGLHAAEDQLLFTNQNGIAGSYTASSGALQLTGSASKADYQMAIRSVRYQNNSSTPSDSPRIISVTVNDGISNSTPATITLTINRAPVITPPTSQAGAGENFVIDIGSLVTDPDNNLDLANINSIAIITPPVSGASAMVTNGQLIINYSDVPDFIGTDRLTIAACDNLGRCSTEEITIEVDAALEVFNAVSPYPDGLNDFLFLRYIRPGNKVTIYNRWGDKVFDVSDYNNTDPGKRFEGLSDQGNELPSGTYFYKIEYGKEVAATGYLSLKR